MTNQELQEHFVRCKTWQDSEQWEILASMYFERGYVLNAEYCVRAADACPRALLWKRRHSMIPLTTHPVSTDEPYPPSGDAEKTELLLPASSLLGRRFMLCTGQCVTFLDLEKYPHSHILGELRYITDEGRKVVVLAVYETSLSVKDVPVALPPIRVEIIGDARRIKCTCCIRRERWEIGKNAFLALMRKYRKDLIGTDV